MNGIKSFSRRFSFFLLILLALAPSCKDDFDSSIPYVEVNFYVNLVNHNALYTVGYPEYFNGGYGGIVIVNNGVSYYAYDMTCPYETDFNCRLKDDHDVIGSCSCCDTQYNLLDGGYVISGLSAEPLKQYRVNLSGSRLHVTN
jgi:nitrite reductase/ring-hydroxylating ferredoxin subunit